MPVAVSLAELVKTPGTQALWPEQFVALMAKADEELTHNSFDQAAWAVIADWCKEHEEDDLAETFFWLHRRREVRPAVNYINGTEQWSFLRLPDVIKAGGNPDGDLSSLAGAVAVLAARIRRAKEALE